MNRSATSPVHGKAVFITGAARGVGAEVASRLHGNGAKLVLTDLDEAPLNDLAAALGDDRVLTIAADVRDLDAMQSAAAAGVERFGGIDVVVANAGIATYGSVLHADPEAFKTLIDVNVLGVYYAVRAVLPSVIDRRGYVLIVSSAAAYSAIPGSASYCASKAGVEHFANTLRLEVAHLGVDVGSAHMSWIDTPLVRETHEWASLQEMKSQMRGPFGKTTSVEKCGEAFVRGIERRKRRINCPGWVGFVRWLKPLLSTSVGESQMLKSVPDLLPKLDTEIAALGRNMSARIESLEKKPTT